MIRGFKIFLGPVRLMPQLYTSTLSSISDIKREGRRNHSQDRTDCDSLASDYSNFYCASAN